MRPRKLGHRPSEELVDIRERGLPWLFSVFVVLFLLLTILLFYFIFTTRDIYLSQKQAIEEEDTKKKEAAAHTKTESYEDEETWKEQTRRKGKWKQTEKKVPVDIVPILDRKTGNPDRPSVLDMSNIVTEKNVTINIEPTVTSVAEEPTTTPIATSITTVTTSTQGPPSTTVTATTSATTTTSTTSSTTTTSTAMTTSKTEPTTEEPTTEKPITVAIETFSTLSTPQNSPQDSDETSETLLSSELEDDLDDVQVEEYEETTTTSTPITTTSTPSTSTTTAAATTTAPPFTSITLETTERTSPATRRNLTRIIWDQRPIKSRSKKFSKFAIISHHEECSKIGKKIYEAGGNSIDATVASEFCISAVHPHSTGPGFGAVMLIHSKKKNGTFVIDGRERAPKNANRNTFVINPTIAHIGYSSMGIPGWISVLWTAYKQFGSGSIGWKSLIEPTLELLETNRARVDRILGQAFESRKNHVLHEKSFSNWLNSTTREGVVLRNPEYEAFLKQLKETAHAEHDFYGGHFSKTIVEEMKSRGGLISRKDLEVYNCIVTRAESFKVGEHYLAGPHLPYHFAILGKVFQNVTDSISLNPENVLEYYVDFVELLQKANQMKSFVGDDLFEPEVRPKIDEWMTPADFKPEEQVEQNQQKRKQVSFSRILSADEGSAVNFMSTNGVPWGSVRRSSTLGFVWNNAMSSFDVFCKHDTNCVRGGNRPSAPNGFPTMLLDSAKLPQLLISPSSNFLETTAALVFQSTLMNMSPLISMDHPRIYPQSVDQVFVEAGIPHDLYRALWTKFRAQFSHPTGPATLLHRDSETSSVEAVCDFRQSTTFCYPSGA